MANRFVIIGYDHGNSELIETNDFKVGQWIAKDKKKDKNFVVVYAGSLLDLIERLNREPKS